MSIEKIADEIIKSASIGSAVKGAGRMVGGAFAGASMGLNKGMDTNKNNPGMSEEHQNKNLLTGGLAGGVIGGALAGPGVSVAKKGVNAIKGLKKVADMEVPTEDEKKKENNEVSEEVTNSYK